MRHHEAACVSTSGGSARTDPGGVCAKRRPQSARQPCQPLRSTRELQPAPIYVRLRNTGAYIKARTGLRR
eukprot:8582342-Alexandrium_andersonii.AAC.1